MQKEILINLAIVIDNEYLDKYIDLVNSCAENKPIKSKTQKHHIIPKSYFKKIGKEVDNSSENIVNLYHYQHILAHWYLFKCAKEDYFIYSNSYALLYMLRIHELPTEEEAIITLAVNYGEVYGEFCKQQSARYKGKPGPTKGRKASLETRKKLSIAHIGQVQSAETKEKRRKTLLRMYEKGEINRTVSEDTKNKLRESIKGRKWMNNGIQNKQVKPEDVERYQASGWVFGIFLTSEQHNKRSELQRGRVYSDESRKRMSVAAKNRDPITRQGCGRPYKMYTDGKQNKRAYTEEQEADLLKRGFQLGTAKQIKRNENNKALRTDIWAREEIDTLKQNYGKTTRANLLALLPNRNWTSICSRASMLHLTKPYKRFNKCRCIETNIVYESFAEAGRMCNINPDLISACTKGKVKSAGGFHWELAL